MTGSVGWYRRDFTLPAGAFAEICARSLPQLDHSLRVGQLRRHGVAQRPPDRPSRRCLPAVRIRPEGRCTAASTGWSSASMTAATPPLCRPARAAAGGTSAASSARSTCARWREPTSRWPRSGPSCPAPPAPRPSSEQATVTNPTGSPQTVVLQGSYGGHKLNFGGHTIPAGGTWVAHAATRLSAPHLWSTGSPYLYQATLTLVRRPRPPPRGLLHRQRRAEHHGRLPTATCLLNGRAAQPARGQHPRAEPPDRRGAEPHPAAVPRRLDARARRDDHPRPLPAQSRDRADGRPGRDPALVRDPRLPDVHAVPAQPGLAGLCPRRTAREHPRQPEPPLDPALEHR